MSKSKKYIICYKMVDGQVFKRSVISQSYREAYLSVCNELEQTCFSVRECPFEILVSANVINLDIVEKL